MASAPARLIVTGGTNVGKTAALASQVALYLRHGYRPDQVVVLGFLTPTVALLAHHLRPVAPEVRVATLHQYCALQVPEARLADDTLWGQIMAVIAQETKQLKLAVEDGLTTSEIGSILRHAGFLRYGDYVTEALARTWPQAPAVVIDDYQDIPEAYHAVVDRLLAQLETLAIAYNPEYLAYSFLPGQRAPVTPSGVEVRALAPAVKALPMPMVQTILRRDALASVPNPSSSLGRSVISGAVGAIGSAVTAICREVYQHQSQLSNISIVAPTNAEVALVCAQLKGYGIDAAASRFTWTALPLHMVPALLNLTRRFNPVDFTVVAGCLDQRRMRLRRLYRLLTTLTEFPQLAPPGYTLAGLAPVGAALVALLEAVLRAPPPSDDPRMLADYLVELIQGVPGLIRYVNDCSYNSEALRLAVDELSAHWQTLWQHPYGGGVAWWLGSGHDITRPAVPGRVEVATAHSARALPVVVAMPNISGPLLHHASRGADRVYVAAA